MSEKPTKPWHVERTSVYGSNGVIVATLGAYTTDEDSAVVAASYELRESLKEMSRALAEVVCNMTATDLERYKQHLQLVKVDGEGLFSRSAAALAKAEGRSNG